MATIISRNPDETRRAGMETGTRLRPGDVLALVGALGAGKTNFVKGLAEGLGITSEPSSPTFTLIHEYPGGRLPLFHVDLYRLESPEEALEIGLDEYFDSGGVTAIEWADKFPQLLPERTLWIRFRQLDETSREIVLP